MRCNWKTQEPGEHIDHDEGGIAGTASGWIGRCSCSSSRRRPNELSGEGPTEVLECRYEGNDPLQGGNALDMDIQRTSVVCGPAG